MGGGGISQDYRRKIKEYMGRLHKLRSRRDRHGVQLYIDARWEYMKLLENQETYWKQMAKQFWLREGDQNTRFFHKYTSTRRENNQIKKIKDVNGSGRKLQKG